MQDPGEGEERVLNGETGGGRVGDGEIAETG